MESEIEVKDILRQPPPLIKILKIFESSPPFFFNFSCEDLLNESGPPTFKNDATCLLKDGNGKLKMTIRVYTEKYCPMY